MAVSADQVAVGRHPLVAEVAARLAGRCGVAAGARLAVGASGGADSTALLLAAAALRDRGTLAAPIAVHVHHDLRGGADDDAAFVESLCDRLDVELAVRRPRPGDLPGNLAANARRLRYEALASAAREHDARYVAVAHHAEDQLETLLMALGRGGGLDGLSGMPWRRSLADGVELLRPLLAASRADCEALCRAAGVIWCDDPTNSDPRTVRARLRRDVLGVLAELWPDAAKRAAGTAELVDAARAVLDRRLDECFGPASARRWDRGALRDLPPAVVASGLRRAALDAAPGVADDLGQAQLLPVAEAVADETRRPRAWSWPGGLRARVTARAVELLSDRA